MRILITTDTAGGVWTCTHELVRGLCNQGHEVLLAALGPEPTRRQCADVEEIPGCQLEHRTCKLEWMASPWDDVDAANVWLEGLARRWQPDLLHLNTLGNHARAGGVPVVRTVHSCVYSWYAAVQGCEPQRSLWQIYYERVQTQLNTADVLVTPTRALAEALSVYALDRAVLGAIQVIPNGRDPHFYEVLDRKVPLFLGAGRLWDEAKNLAALSAVADRLRWPVEVAGEPPESEPSTRLRLLGQLESQALARRMSEAAVFVHPALYEPFGLAVLEAGLSGCALVLGAIPSLQAVWGEAAALYVPPKDTEALRATLDWVSATPERWRSLGAKARERALTYTAERMSTAYLALYTQLLSGAARSSRSPLL